jgi:hypothetical protein
VHNTRGWGVFEGISLPYEFPRCCFIFARVMSSALRLGLAAKNVADLTANKIIGKAS